ncbi:cobalamin biosynthesis protein [Paraburkholderia sp. SIMBA_030]|uniref:cobalamin biosynthesis protein n=1 Tax=Paraburkholderia sp. SIMBA_030 TaxID=3085773 RepID=UPI00397A5D87
MKTLSVGIGCRLHCSAEQIDTAVRAALGHHTLDEISAIATIDVKAQEAGLLEFCARHALPLQRFSREQIAALTIADAEPSTAAREHLGVDGVCEPCALLAAAAAQPNAPDARLIVRKTVLDSVTVAIASTAHAGIDPTHDDSDEQDLP